MYYVVKIMKSADPSNVGHVCITKDPTAQDSVIAGPLPHDEARAEMERHWVRGSYFPRRTPPNSDYERLIAAAPELLAALEAIAGIAGTLPDDRLTTRTGPNDAVARGLMVTDARRIARAVVAKAKGGA